MEGWISLHRSLLEWEWYTDTNVTRLFIHCLLKANHSEAKWRGNTIEVGSFITSLSKLSNELGLSIKQVRTVLDKLKSTGEVGTERGKAWTKITVCKYASYQQKENLKGNTRAEEGQRKGKGRATNNNNNKNNNENNDNKTSSSIRPNDFNYFWDLYPKKKAKGQALTDWGKLCKKGIAPKLAEIEKAVAEQKDTLQWKKEKGQFIPNASTWLNNSRWLDDPTEMNADYDDKPKTKANVVTANTRANLKNKVYDDF